jgi:hypothetical protein
MFILTISNPEFFIQFSELLLFIFCPFFGWPNISGLTTPLELKKNDQQNICQEQKSEKANTETDQDS